MLSAMAKVEAKTRMDNAPNFRTGLRGPISYTSPDSLETRSGWPVVCVCRPVRFRFQQINFDPFKKNALSGNWLLAQDIWFRARGDCVGHLGPVRLSELDGPGQTRAGHVVSCQHGAFEIRNGDMDTAENGIVDVGQRDHCRNMFREAPGPVRRSGVAAGACDVGQRKALKRLFGMDAAAVHQDRNIMDLDVAEAEVPDRRNALIARHEIRLILDAAVEDVEPQESQLRAGYLQVIHGDVFDERAPARAALDVDGVRSRAIAFAVIDLDAADAA